MRHFTGISRAALTLVLGALGALCLTLAVIRTWAADVIYDDDRFAGTAVKVLRRDEVRSEVRKVVVDQVIEQQPDLVSARPLIETVVDTALQSKAFDGIMAAAARELHRTVFETEQRTLILNLSDIMTVAVAAVRAYDAELAGRIPGGPDTGAIEIATRSTGTRIAEFDRQLSALRWLLLAVALASFAGCALVGGSIRRAVTITGVALVACAILAWLGVSLTAEILRHRIGGDAVLGDAVAAAWEIYAEELVWWMWVQALAGMFAAIVASSLIATKPATDRLVGIGRWFESAWATRAGRAVFSGGLATLGVLLLISPVSTVEVLARAGGLTLVYLGGTEMLRGLGLARERSPRRADSPRDAVEEALPRVLAAGGLVTGLAVVGLVFWTNRDSLRADSANAVVAIESCNGMAELCDRRLGEVVFAATHNSMGAAEEPGWYFAEHIHPIRRQLEDGVRGLLVDVYYGYATNRGVRTDPSTATVTERLEPWFGPAALASALNLANAYGPIPAGSTPALYLCHGYCELGATPFDRVMSQLTSFLNENPHEVVLMVLQDYVEPAAVVASFERTRLIDYVYTLAPGAPMPTLREMIESGRRVVVFSENLDDPAAPAWYHSAFELIQDTPYSFRSATEFSCDPFRGEEESPFFLLNHWISRSSPTPRDAQEANAFDLLHGRATQCQQERGRLPNLIAVNFYETGDIFQVVDALNEEFEP